MIAVGRGNGSEGLATIVGPINAGIQDVHGVRGFWVGKNVGVIPGALAEAVIVGEQLPVFAAIVGAVDAAFFRFDDSPDAIGIGSGNGDADASFDAFGKAVLFDFFPGAAAVRGTIKAATGTSAVHAPRRALGLP